MTSSITDRTSGKKIIIASGIGNFVEWFDFTLYGYSAVVIAQVFFPPDDGAAALLATFAVYGVAFLTRPAGAIFFGRIGDRLGRRGALALSILLMGGATAAIGLIPGYATIGVAAPILLLICRLLQGFSAGGEYSGAVTFTVEHAPGQGRGMWLALLGISTTLGTVGATATVLGFRLGLGEEGFTAGGWRWPFLIGGLISLVGLYLRTKLAETPAFAEVEPEQRPLTELVRGHWRVMLVVLVYFAFVGVFTHIVLGYMPTYLMKAVDLDQTTALYLTTGLMLIGVPLAPLLGLVVDRVGRRPLIRIGVLGGVLATVPAFLLMGTGNMVAVSAGLLVLLVVIFGTNAAGTLAVLEMYPTKVRFSGMALPYNVAYALFAGTAPLVSEGLIGATGSLLAPAFYATAIAVVACPILFRGIPETRGGDLRTGVTAAR
ncbi:MFS transporter [Nonomuraea sp. NPDC046570]|uniref:MFS transporter n=1 Tax=Nonomuraea sp. NPDC046570 TaxID=3155255 RepID=UPI003400A1DD